MTDYSYQGQELDLFKNAVNWKQYYAGHLREYVRGDVLEVGAGIGGTGRFLCHAGVTTWTCLEPDSRMAGELDSAIQADPFPVPARVTCGTLATLPPDRRFDTILYIDVLEHIEDDRAELDAAATRLRPAGHLVVLSPAHNWLFSPFDAAIGHFRRYSRRTLVGVGPARLLLTAAFYLDSVGMAASLANKILLRAASPTLAQIRFWDSRIIPVSRVADALFARRLGKTVVAIWQRTQGSAASAAHTYDASRA